MLTSQFVRRGEVNVKSLPILNEKTQLFSQSNFSDSIDKYFREVAYIPPKRLLKCQRKVDKIIRYVFPRMKKHAIKIGLRMKTPIYSGSVYNDLHSNVVDEVDVLFPFDKEKTKIDSVEPGYVVIPLRRHKQVGDVPDPWRYGRSVDGMYLSPIQVSRTMHELLHRALTIPVDVPNVLLEPLFDDGRPPRIRIVLGGTLKINIIPAIIQGDGKPVLVTRCYMYDHNPNSDMLWRLLFSEKEEKILSLMDHADRGRRRQALKIMKSLFLKEHTLHGISSYHLKTVLLHTFDSEVDQTPRWQRDLLETCILSFFKDLLTYLKSRRLPHFYVRDCNLFENVPPRILTKLRNRVAYIVNNENELVRILKKRDDKTRGNKLQLYSNKNLMLSNNFHRFDHKDGGHSDSSIPSTEQDSMSTVSSFPGISQTGTRRMSGISLLSNDPPFYLNGSIENLDLQEDASTETS